MRTFLILVVVLAVAIVGGLWLENEVFTGYPSAREQETVVIVKPGSSLSQIADQLERAGVIDSAFLFRIGVMRRGKSASLKAGEYEFSENPTMARVMEMLVNHETVQHKITIPEGYTSGMAVAVVNNDAVMEGPPATEPPEGSLLPETYLFERGTTRTEILARMHKAQADLIAALWPKRQPGLPYKSPREALIMASLVEKETGVPSERGRIARVFLNRLRLGMKLEADPTIIYGLTKGVPLGHPLRVSELAKPNPYSTYQIVGLPPGPICNPGRNAIMAVLNPPPSDELYFVANGTGGHAFATTLAEHEKHVAQWRHIEDDRAPAPTPAPAPAPNPRQHTISPH
jgi:UPF0755 protein